MSPLRKNVVDVWRKFLRTFRSLGELWDPQHAHYGEVNKVDAGFAKLLKVIQLTEPDADNARVINKIHEFISTFVNECNQQKITGKSCQLWYCEELRFLVDAKLICIGDSSKSNMAWCNTICYPSSLSEDNVCFLESAIEEAPVDLGVAVKVENCTVELDPLADGDAMALADNGSHNHNSTIVSPKSPPPLIPCAFPLLPSNLPPLSYFKPINNINPQPTKPVESTECTHRMARCSLFAKNIATKLKGLDSLQKLLVEKIINEVIFEAELGNLKRYHVSNIQDALKECLETSERL